MVRKSQEKLRKMTKFRKSHVKVIEKHQILSVQIYKIPYI